MASGAMVPSLLSGGIIGHEWSRYLGYPEKAQQGAVFSALWMSTAMIISHSSLQWQSHITSENRIIYHAIGVSSFALALLSGALWEVILSKAFGFSIPSKLPQVLSGAAIASAQKTYSIYFVLR